MNFRVIQAIHMIALLFSVNLYATELKEIQLYPGEGILESASFTFPEPPEWKTNWGNKGGLEPPYIRFSGQKNYDSDWNAILKFEKLPLKLDGGFLSFKAFVTEQVELELSLGNSSKKNVSLPANTAREIKISLEDIFDSFPVEVSSLNLKLKGVPAWHYITLLVGEISIYSKKSENESNLEFPTLESSETFVLSETDFSKPSRDFMEGSFTLPYSRAGYSIEVRDSLKNISSTGIFLSEMENEKIKEMPKEISVSSFMNKAYLFAKNLVRDSVIANPRTLLQNGKLLSASHDYTLLPILAMDVDYDASECEALSADSSCAKYQVVKGHFLGAAPALEFVRGSQIQLVFDPYFWLSNRNGEQSFELEVSVAGKNYSMKGASVVMIEFPQLGKYEMVLRVQRAGIKTEWKYTVEVQ